jgi:hypothetical protein
MERAGAPIVLYRLPHTKLTHPRRLFGKCNGLEPDVLILQLGHAELNVPLSSYLPAFGRPRRPKSDSKDIPPSAFVRTRPCST